MLLKQLLKEHALSSPVNRDQKWRNDFVFCYRQFQETEPLIQFKTDR